MKKFLTIFLAIILPFSLFLAGCGNDQGNNNEKKSGTVTVYTTVYPLQYFTEVIGGDYVSVKSIYPPGVDEHTFEPTQKDMMNLVDADLFFYIGLGLEGFVEKAKDTFKNEDVKMIATAENLPIDKNEENGHTEEDEHGHSVDPHVWLDPIYAKELAKTIKDALVEQLPEQKETFEKNYEGLTADLDEINTAFEETVQTSKHKEIIVAHSAYGYWEKRYGIKQISISGLSTTNEPSQKKLEEIIEQAKKYDIHYIFFEQNYNSKLAQIVENELGAKPLTLHNLSVLTQENIDNDDTYFTIMNQNIEALKTALNN